MKLAILHSLPLLDATLDSASLAWLVGGFVAAIILLILGVLATAPSRRRARTAAALVKPAETLAAVAPAPSVEVPAADAPIAIMPVALAVPAPAPAPDAPAAPAVSEGAEPEPLSESETATPAAEDATLEPTISEPAAPAPVFAPESSQPAIPIPVGPDFSASGPLMLPASMVAATFGSATETAPVTTEPPMPLAIDEPASESTVTPASSVSGPLMPPGAPAIPAAPVAPAVPFVVTPISAPAVSSVPETTEEPAPTPAPAAATNGATHAERVPLPDAVDLFAHSYGRSNAAMLSATERAAAARISRALHDDPLAIQLAGMYAAATHRPDNLAQLLETDRRNQLAHGGRPRPVSTGDALDVFAGSYGRSNAAMLSATERSAATRIVHALDGDPLAVRLAGLYAANAYRPLDSLDSLASRLETDLRHTSGRHNRRHRA